MSTDGQGTKWRRNIAQNFNRLSRVHDRYRQTTDRQKDGRTMTYNSCSLKTEAAAANGRQVVCGRYCNESYKTSTNRKAPVRSLPLGIMLSADTFFTESMQTCERLRSRVDVVTNLADQKLVVNLFHQFLTSRHGGTLCLERLRAPRLRQSSVRTGYNRTQHGISIEL